MHLDAVERSEFFEFAGDVADADGAVVCGAVRIPLLHEGPGANWKFVAAVRIADL